ncbi:MAG: hypothetical protein R2932_59985 [Caldilineaceae bacterium]
MIKSIGRGRHVCDDHMGCAPVAAPAGESADTGSSDLKWRDRHVGIYAVVGAGAARRGNSCLMDEFEAQNPGIKVELISGPYASGPRSKWSLAWRQGRCPMSWVSTGMGQ